ncbi:hypothetical protein EMCRGX_G001486 [Ephydatia muelleri]
MSDAEQMPLAQSGSNHEEHQYLNLLRNILKHGHDKEDRTGIGTKSIFGAQMRFSLRHSFPLLTTRKMRFKNAAEEIIWCVAGDTNSKHLSEKGVSIWNKFGTKEYLEKRGFPNREEGDLGPLYGFQWRHFGAEYTDMNADYSGKGIDQLTDVIETIKKNPNDRRMIIAVWNPAACSTVLVSIKYSTSTKSKKRAEYLQKQDDILIQENKAKARARYKAEKKASVRDSYKADPEKKKASVRDSYNADIESKQSAKRQQYQEDLEENRAAKRQRYQEDVEENRAAKRQRYQEDLEETALLKGRNTRTIQLPLRHLKGIGIGMTPLSDWLNVLPRGSGIAGVTELPLPPKAVAAALPPTAATTSRSSSRAAPAATTSSSSSSSTAPSATSSSSSSTAPSATSRSSSRAAPTATSRSRSTAATTTSPTTGTSSIDTSAPTAATTTHMAPMARTRPPRP